MDRSPSPAASLCRFELAALKYIPWEAATAAAPARENLGSVPVARAVPRAAETAPLDGGVIPGPKLVGRLSMS